MDMVKRIKAAKGEIKADLVIKNAKICDLLCHRIYEGSVAVTDGVIVGTGDYEGEKIIDAEGGFLLPSFVESHVHIESSMLSPGEFARIEAAHGVTEVIADPHEIANIAGENGLKFMVESAKGLPVNIRLMLPSCVPATPFDNSGAVIDAKMTRLLMDKYGFYGLGEMMNYPGVLSENRDVLEKLSCADIIDGHAPSLKGKMLSAYLTAGILTDHECVTIEEALEKISKGMYVMLREGSQSKELEKLTGIINQGTIRRILFCTDDKHLGDMMAEGTISNCVRKAINLGVDPLDAFTIACLNPSECYKLGRRGLIAPSYSADMIITKELTCEHITHVFKSGELIAKDGEALFEGHVADMSLVSKSVHIKHMTKKDFELEFKPSMTAIEVMKHSLVTKACHPETKRGLNLCAVIERHHNTGNIGRCYIKGFDLKGGAIAQSIGHDSHNITVVGDDEASMAAAVNALGEDGGISVARNGKAIAFMPLEIGGVMTKKTAREALNEHEAVMRAAEGLDMNKDIDPFMLMAFLPLLVIPSLKISDRGLFDVDGFKFLREL